MFKGLILATAVATFAALFIAGVASAQYPEPKGSLVCTTKVNVQVNGTEIYATLRDSQGKPVNGARVNFRVSGGSGSLDSTSDDTDGNGVAWVKANSTNISVVAVYDGLQCSAIAQVAGQTFYPPSTGDAGLAATGNGTDRITSPLVGICLAVLGATGVGVVVLRRRPEAVEVRS